MSETAQSASLMALIADFALVDPTGKLNILGANVDILGFDAVQGSTARFTLVCTIALPAQACPADLSVEIALLDAAGDIAELPGPAGPQKMRIGHVATIEKPVPPPGTGVSRETLRGRANVLMDFPGGLPLTAGASYRWRLQIDADESAQFFAPFAVAGPPTGVVIG